MTRNLVVSPHLDDAALSVGALLYRLAAAGQEVTVVTLFAGVPQPPYSEAADFVHKIWGMSDRWIEQRRDEDKRAMRCLGTDLRHEDYLDAIYRRDDDGSWLLSENRMPWEYAEESEPELRAVLAATMREMLRSFAPDRILTCAAIGNHVDHRRTRDAVLDAVRGEDVRVDLWEDLPYGVFAHDLPTAPRITHPGERITEPADERAWMAKRAAVECYVSQHSMLSYEGDFRDHLEARGRAHGAEYGPEVRAEALWSYRWSRKDADASA